MNMDMDMNMKKKIGQEMEILRIDRKREGREGAEIRENTENTISKCNRKEEINNDRKK